MPQFGTSAAAAVPLDDLVLPCKLPDGSVRQYRVKPCTAGELLDLMAVDAMWNEIGRQRWHRIATATSGEVGAQIAPADPALAERIARLMDGPMSPEDILAMPLGPDVAKAMLADGVGKTEYMLAVMTAMYWHIAGDDAAKEVWSTGKMPGKPVARPPRNSRSTASGATGAARSKVTTSHRKSKRGS